VVRAGDRAGTLSLARLRSGCAPHGRQSAPVGNAPFTIQSDKRKAIAPAARRKAPASMKSPAAKAANAASRNHQPVMFAGDLNKAVLSAARGRE
jgi:hypothetical protein